MNILIGPLNTDNEISILSSVYVLGEHFNLNNIKVFNNLKGNINLSFEEILSEAEDSEWEADIIIFWRPEYEPLPYGIEKAKIPVIGVIIDWTLEVEAVLETIKYFDWVFTDKKGLNFFNSLGYKNVSYWTVAGYVPGLHEKIPYEPKVYDAVFIGGLNHSIHGHRLSFLHRLSVLGEKYKIKITGGVYGKDYVKLINRSKIVFNHAIRGELNMRAYETMACGSLLFMEEDNMEAALHFQPGKDFVTYNESNFEQLLEYYINNDEEREVVAENGYKAVEKHSYELHFQDLLVKISSLPLIKKPKSIPFNTFLKQLFRPNSHILIIENSMSKYFSTVCSYYSDNIENLKNESEFFNNFAVCSILNKHLNSKIISNEIKYLNQAISLNKYSIANFNLGLVLILLNNTLMAEKQFNKVLELLKPELLETSGLLLSFNYSGNLKLKFEAQNIYHSDKKLIHSEKTKVLLDKVYEIMGDIYINKNLLFLAKDYYIKITDKSGKIYFKLAEIELIGGNTEKSMYFMQESIKLEPFNINSLETLKRIFIDTRKNEAAKAVQREIINLKTVSNIKT